MKRHNPIFVFLLTSLLIHLCFLGVGLFRTLDHPKRLEELEVTLLTPTIPHQIADIAPPEKEERPDKAKFLGLYDSRVEKEQVMATPPRGPRTRWMRSPFGRTQPSSTSPTGSGNDATWRSPPAFTT